MGKTIQLNITVPKEAATELSIIFWKMSYERDEQNKVIVEAIMANTGKRAGEIRWLLEKKGIFINPLRVIKMAERIGIQIKK